MATLRNKTMDQGSIIRWKPQPDRTRPSTYQVEPSAIWLLRELGYEAPTPGDEADVPWQVCWPPRILGGLHFEDEQRGTVETIYTTTNADSVGTPLSDRQSSVAGVHRITPAIRTGDTPTTVDRTQRRFVR